ncbi:MAG TPA: hypothetical protein VIR57_06655 [Chloroflexota bacterium]|jgi:hypothetical protein
MPRRHPAPDKPRCTATVWNTGQPCAALAAPAAPYCTAHLALIPPDEWAAGGYAAILAPASQPLFRAARFVDVSEEIALARLHLRSLFAGQAPTTELLAGFNILAKLIKLRHDIDQTRYEHGSAYLQSKL